MGLVAVRKTGKNDNDSLDELLKRSGPVAVCFTDGDGDTVAFQFDLDALKSNDIAKTFTLKTK